jgi:hypothetical protein
VRASGTEQRARRLAAEAISVDVKDRHFNALGSWPIARVPVCWRHGTRGADPGLASGRRPRTDGADPYDETADALLVMGRLAAQRLDPERISEFPRLLESEMRAGRFGDHPVFAEWLRRADLGPDALTNALLDCTERGRYMRSMAPLRIFDSKEERFEILRGIARKHGFADRPHEAERER